MVNSYRSPEGSAQFASSTSITDEALSRLKMPVMVILGGKDAIPDSDATRQRLERTLPHAEIRYLPEAGHFLPGQTAAIRDFLIGSR